MQFLRLVKRALPEFFMGRRVLEVGSYDVNGEARRMFDDCDYIGLDVGPGPGVDVVVPGQSYDAPDECFDVVLSCECMEHNPQWAATSMNMMRVLKPGGLFLLTCASPGRKEHGTTRTTPGSSPPTVGLGQEHYENLYGADFAAIPGLFRSLDFRADWLNWMHHDYYLLGIKGPVDEPPRGWSVLTSDVDSWLRQHNPKGVKAVGKRVVLRVGGKKVFAIARRVTA
jgi:SAM-dependent methyltransferase